MKNPESLAKTIAEISAAAAACRDVAGLKALSARWNRRAARFGPRHGGLRLGHLCAHAARVFGLRAQALESRLAGDLETSRLSEDLAESALFFLVNG